MLPGRALGLQLERQCEEFSRLLLLCPLHEIKGEGRLWLHRRYAEIVPLVLPAALHAIEYGHRLPDRCLEDLRAAASKSARDPQVKLAVVLRGSLPALRVFALVMCTASLKNPATLGLAMTRASLIAQELGTCWTEAWDQHRTALEPSVTTRSPAASIPDIAPPPKPDLTLAPPVFRDVLDLVAESSGLDETEKLMLTLAAYGLSNEAIAKETSYSKQAVVWHLSRLMKAWKAPNRTALVSLAFVKGIIRSRIPHGVRGHHIRSNDKTRNRPVPQDRR